MISVNKVVEVLHRMPLRLNFAGLVGTTTGMRDQGWELNVHDRQSFEYQGLNVVISGIHRGYGLSMFTAPLRIGYSMIARADNMSSLFDQIQNGALEAVVKTCSPNMQFVNPEKMNPLSQNWSGYLDFKKPSEAQNFSDYFGFPEVGTVLIIPESKIWTVQEHLDAIRAVQQPAQDEMMKSAMDKKYTKDILKLVAC